MQKVVPLEGVEPSTRGLGNRCSIQLSYRGQFPQLLYRMLGCLVSLSPFCFDSHIHSVNRTSTSCCLIVFSSAGSSLYNVDTSEKQKDRAR
jgi:hypothetical protein